MLLTRLPLDLKEASFLLLSFDLHVLSTPPAFVLSQDQTLHDRLFVWLDLFLALLKFIARYCYLAHRLDSFAVLFSFQRTIALQATSLSYHIRRSLSNDFFEIFFIALSNGAASSATGIILSHPGLLCQQVFLNFFYGSGFGVQGALGTCWHLITFENLD